MNIAQTSAPAEIEQRYQRAEQLLPWHLATKLGNTKIEPHWLDAHRFWFKRELCDHNGDYSQGDHEFILVDCQQLTQEPLFDHQRLADVLSELTDQPFAPNQLPIISLELSTDNQLRLQLEPKMAPNREILIALSTYQGKVLEIDNSLSVVSPDGRMEVVSRDHNLYLRAVPFCPSTGTEKALSTDGEAYFAYGNCSDYIKVGICANQPLPPAVSWSPDGRYLAVQRIDERRVKNQALQQSVPQDGSVRPLHHPYKFSMPGDTQIALASICIIDMDSGEMFDSDRPPAAGLGGVMIEHACWSSNHCFYHSEWSRDRQTVRLVELNPVSKTSRVLIEEKNREHSHLHPGPIPFEPAVFTVLPEIGEFIWYSHSSGWGHLYRYNLATGQLINAMTCGEYVVTALHRADSETGRVYFTACGREPEQNPYFEHFYRVNLDGSDLTLLTSEAGQHDIVPPGFVADNFCHIPSVHSLSPGGEFFIDTVSRLDRPYKTVLRLCRDGSELMGLSQCEGALLNDPVYKPPLSFTANSADGTTELWGVLHRPSDFTPSQSYPVILAVYGGPHMCIVPKRFAECVQYVNQVARTLAELGCIVVSLDPRGTPLRSSAFQNAVYGNLQNGGGIDDQIAALQQLGERYPWMDMQRVGITGHSNGGFTAARAMLSHPDFFKVAVASAGNHDQRGYVSSWGETFQGCPKGDNYRAQASVHMAKNLKGKLLLVHGDMDANVHIAHSLQLADQLIEHNKDFDLLILPNRQHNYMQDRYFIRRVWDYFSQHLLNDIPPDAYHIAPPTKV